MRIIGYKISPTVTPTAYLSTLRHTSSFLPSALYLDNVHPRFIKVEMKEEEPSIGSLAHPPGPGNPEDMAVRLKNTTPPMSNSQAARAPSDPITPPVNPLTSPHDNPIIAGRGPVTSPTPMTSPLTRPSSHARQQHVPAPAQPPDPAPTADPFTSHAERIAQDYKKFKETPDKGLEVLSSEFRSVITSAYQYPSWERWAEVLEKNYAGPSVFESKFRMEKTKDVAIWTSLRTRFKTLATAAPSQAFSPAVKQSNAEQESPDEPVEDGGHWESQVAGPANADGENEYQPVKESDRRELQGFLNWKRRHNNTAVTFHDWRLIRNHTMQYDEEFEEEDKKKKADAP